MNIVVTASGKALTDPMDLRFGRARNFIRVNTESGAMTAHDNAQNLNAAQGAGIQAAETVVRLGAEAVITGNVGPKAFRVLNTAGVKIYLSDGGTVSEAVARFKAGEMKEISVANVEGHWA